MCNPLCGLDLPAHKRPNRGRIESVVADQPRHFDVGREFAADERREAYRDAAGVLVEAIGGEAEARRRGTEVLRHAHGDELAFSLELVDPGRGHARNESSELLTRKRDT
jgi:hypothetical protein